MATVLTQAQAIAALRALGWRIRTTGEYRQAVVHFQGAWSLGTRLSVDGKVGPLTSAALIRSEQARKAGKPTASEHFSFREFACTCGGRFSACARQWPSRDLILSLELLRDRAYPRGLRVVSGCRCAGRNAEVNGASGSQHLLGSAADVVPVATVAQLRTWGLFAGLGHSPANLVRHVDRRDVSGSNPTNGTRSRPTVWAYDR